nr:MAG TPA: hypothetical protein [Microviridae sp.]
MINQPGDGIKRHRTSSPVLDVNISKQLVGVLIRNSNNTIHIRLVLTDPLIRQLGKLGIVITKMPNVQGLSISGAHLTGNSIGLIPIISPGFLITKDLIILGSTLGIDLLVQHGLFTNVRQDRPVIIKATLTAPEAFNTLLIGMIITSDHNTDHETVLHERLHKVTMDVSSQRVSGSITKRSSAFGGRTLLYNLIDIDGNTGSTKILRPLETSIRRSNAKMRFQDLNITSTATSITLIKLLDLKSSSQLIDSSNGDSVIKLSPEISRVTGNTIINGRIQIRITSIRKPIRTTERILMNRTSMITSLKITITIRYINIVRIIKQILRNRLIHRYNRRIAKLGGLNRHVRAFLGSWKTTGEVIVILTGLEGQTAFGDIGNIGSGIDALHGGVVNRNIERIRQVLISKPLIHNERISSKWQRINRKILNASGNTHVIGNRTNRPPRSWGRQLRDLIFSLRDPSRFRVFAIELLPVFPGKTVRNKEEISVQINIIHQRG